MIMTLVDLQTPHSFRLCETFEAVTAHPISSIQFKSQLFAQGNFVQGERLRTHVTEPSIYVGPKSEVPLNTTPVTLLHQFTLNLHRSVKPQTAALHLQCKG